MFRKLALLLCLLFLLPAKASQALPDGGRKYASLDGFTFVSTFSKEKASGYKFFIALRDSKWSLLDETVVKGNDFEIVGVNPEAKKIWLIYQRSCPLDKSQMSDKDGCYCFFGLSANQSRARNGYNLCSSSFKKAYISATGAVGAVIAAPILALTGTVGSFMIEDSDAVFAAMNDAGVLDKINNIYYSEYSKALTYMDVDASTLEASVNKYSLEKYDPDLLLPDARARLDVLRIKEKKEASIRDLNAYREKYDSAKNSTFMLREFISQYKNNDPELLLPKAEARLRTLAIAEEKEKSAAEARHREGIKAEQERLTKWRKGLKVGDDTFCGPVIEVKSPMIKIAVRPQLPGYGSEAWLKTSELFPRSFGCSNTNGQLSPLSN